MRRVSSSSHKHEKTPTSVVSSHYNTRQAQKTLSHHHHPSLARTWDGGAFLATTTLRWHHHTTPPLPRSNARQFFLPTTTLYWWHHTRHPTHGPSVTQTQDGGLFLTNAAHHHETPPAAMNQYALYYLYLNHFRSFVLAQLLGLHYLNYLDILTNICILTIP